MISQFSPPVQATCCCWICVLFKWTFVVYDQAENFRLVFDLTFLCSQMKLVVPDIQWVNGHYLGFQSVYLNSPCVAPCFHQIQVFLNFFAEGGLCFCRHKDLRIVRIFEFSPISILQHFCDEKYEKQWREYASLRNSLFWLNGRA